MRHANHTPYHTTPHHNSNTASIAISSCHHSMSCDRLRLVGLEVGLRFGMRDSEVTELGLQKRTYVRGTHTQTHTHTEPEEEGWKGGNQQTMRLASIRMFIDLMSLWMTPRCRHIKTHTRTRKHTHTHTYTLSTHTLWMYSRAITNCSMMAYRSHIGMFKILSNICHHTQPSNNNQPPICAVTA